MTFTPRTPRFRVWDGTTMHGPDSEDARLDLNLDGSYSVEVRRGLKDLGDRYVVCNEAVLLQSTGLTDADGREVFEGDVVVYGTSPEDRYARRGPVTWDRQAAAFCLPGQSSMRKHEEGGWTFHYWVVGHVFEGENPYWDGLGDHERALARTHIKAHVRLEVERALSDDEAERIARRFETADGAAIRVDASHLVKHR